MRGSRLGSTLIGLWALGFALAGIVLTDPEGRPLDAVKNLHGAAVALAFLSATAGILVLSRIFARDAWWSSFYPLSLALGFAALVGLVYIAVISAGLADLARDLGPVAWHLDGLGVIQRMFVGTIILWMILAATRLRSIAKSGRFLHRR